MGVVNSCRLEFGVQNGGVGPPSDLHFWSGARRKGMWSKAEKNDMFQNGD